MKGEEFREQVIQETMERILELNRTKGRDYAGVDDAFANFKRHATELGLTPEQIWAVYAAKHWDAVLTFCREHAEQGYTPSEPIEGRIDDLILYLMLLKGMARESGEEQTREIAL